MRGGGGGVWRTHPNVFVIEPNRLLHFPARRLPGRGGRLGGGREGPRALLARVGPGRGPGVVVDEIGFPALADARLPPGWEPCCSARGGCWRGSARLAVGDHGDGGAYCALELGGARGERQEGRAAGAAHLDLQTRNVSSAALGIWNEGV